MAKSKSSRLTKNVSGRKKRKSRPIKKNPQQTGLVEASSGFLSQTWSEIANAALPGLVSFGLGCAAGRIGYKLGKRKSMAVAKHAGPLASLAYAVGASVAVSRVEYLQKWDTPIVVGAWIAALKSIAQTYVPQYGWIFNDWHMDDVLPMELPEGSAAATGKTRSAARSMPSNVADELPVGDDDFADIPGLNDAGMNVGIFSGGMSN